MKKQKIFKMFTKCKKYLWDAPEQGSVDIGSVFLNLG